MAKCRVMEEVLEAYPLQGIDTIPQLLRLELRPNLKYVRDEKGYFFNEHGGINIQLFSK